MRSPRILLALAVTAVVAGALAVWAVWLRDDGSDAAPPSALYVINADGSGITRLGGAPTATFNYWGPAWSPDGTSLAVTRFDGALVLVGTDGTERVQLTHDGRTCYLPAWSPDGARLVFVSQQGSDTKTAEIAIVNADGSGARLLTDDDAWDYGASFSPDGGRIVFGSERGGRWRIWTMNADGTDRQPLPTEAQGNAPSWSPDGNWIAFTSDRDGDDDVWLMRHDGSDQRNLTANNAHDDNAAWSRDGTRLVFSSDRSGKNEIWTMNADGGDPVQVTRDNGLWPDIPTWSPDGTKLAFTAHSVS